MLLLPLAVACGAVAGRLSGGRLRYLSRFRLSHSSWLVAALSAQVVLGIASGPLHVTAPTRAATLVASQSAVGLVLLANLPARSRGLQIALATVAAGWFANLVAMLPQGAMPVSRAALGSAGLAGIDVGSGHLGKHVASSGTLLGDSIPIRPLASVVSPGDIVMWLGIACVVALAMRPQSLPALPTLPRKRRVRSSLASPKICDGGPSSTITPDSR